MLVEIVAVPSAVLQLRRKAREMTGAAPTIILALTLIINLAAAISIVGIVVYNDLDLELLEIRQVLEAVIVELKRGNLPG